MQRPTVAGRGFTLMELLVVVALIALLVTVMVPVMLSFMKGRGLGMIGNNFAGFVAFARTEAMNTRQTHVIVTYFEEESLNLGGEFDRKAGPGVVLWRLNPNPTPGSDDLRINYVKQLDFEGGIGGSVDFAKSWKSRAPLGPSLSISDEANQKFVGKYKLVLLPDGRVEVPEDKPGYVLDTGQTKGIRTDMVLTDGTYIVFVDINPATGAMKRSPRVDYEDTDEEP
ncbi:MAG: prepilin-type N-terminal cleavage/methylation domain-containing protein [Planctomycetes bacterium]|nr:prepilin-type N-terminal cleavage/methylation domain-containing protein [Planctomycetota bacterium]MCW8135194.1 prepilin-type N-terminal cleavage/methylation domain-containing protein [Planctomycetota bacterium]